MIKVTKINWDFSDTEFEDCDYEEARQIAILPDSIKIKDLDSDSSEEEIIDYLIENFGFEIDSLEIEER